MAKSHLGADAAHGNSVRGSVAARNNQLTDTIADHPQGTRALAMAGITAWHFGFDRSAVELFAALALDMCDCGPGAVQ